MRWLLAMFVAMALAIAAQEPVLAAAPAGYVVETELPGGDGSGAVIRDGKETPVKLLMPVYEGDVVFVRGGGRIVLELGGGQTVEVGAALPRFEVRGEIDTGDDSWSLISAIAGALSGEGDEAPDNLAARGYSSEITVAATGRGRNLVPRSMGEVGLAWSGGTAPFKIFVESNGGKLLVKETAETTDIVPLSIATEEKFAIIIEDSQSVSRRLRFGWRDRAPDPPDSLLAKVPAQTARLAQAAWLAKTEDGAWAMAAAETLRQTAAEDPVAKQLREMILAGWKPN